jgi:exodeoxyribonuclease V alpha subunit
MLTLSGTVDRIIYKKEEEGFYIIAVTPDDDDVEQGVADLITDFGTVRVSGNMPPVSEGEAVVVRGEKMVHPRYGAQLKVHTLEKPTPTDETGLVAYLQSSFIKGVGPHLAEQIVRHFGVEETVDVLDRQPERLLEIRGIGTATAKTIQESWDAHREIRHILTYLTGLGVTMTMAVKINAKFKPNTIQVVQTTPYRLCEVRGIGFLKADPIALRSGVSPTSPQRIWAGIEYVLSESASNGGHIFLPRRELVEMAAQLMAVDENLVDAQVEVADGSTLVLRHVIDDEGYQVETCYTQPNWITELTLAGHLASIVHAGSIFAARMPYTPPPISETISPEQFAAVENCVRHKLAVITGGPGTGKTTTLRYLLDWLDFAGVTYALCSPTGKAAKRLSESTGREAKTIHRLLGVSSTEGRITFEYNEDKPLPKDLIVVDEASMLDQWLATSLVRAIPSFAHLLLVGDVDQLPSVGAGDVLRDIIKSGFASVNRLSTVFRQAEDSGIISNAHRINRGQTPVVNNTDFFFFKVEEPAEQARILLDVVVNRIPAKFGFDPVYDVQVLSPMKNGDTGTIALNQQLREALNPLRDRRLPSPGGLRVGDKVIQTVNYYKLEVFNGDGGFVRSIDEDTRKVGVEFDTTYAEYEFDEVANNLQHAYALTVHKSQGSEYQCIVMPVTMQQWIMLQRNLVYTGITRAKQVVVLVGTSKAMQRAVSHNPIINRYTSLPQTLSEAMGW